MGVTKRQSRVSGGFKSDCDIGGLSIFELQLRNVYLPFRRHHRQRRHLERKRCGQWTSRRMPCSNVCVGDRDPTKAGQPPLRRRLPGSLLSSASTKTTGGDAQKQMKAKKARGIRSLLANRLKHSHLMAWVLSISLDV